jgi:hypothetical protein
MKLTFVCFVMSDKIRRLSIYVVFKSIWIKGLNFLTNDSFVYLCIMYQSLHDYDYRLSEIRRALFSLIG